MKFYTKNNVYMIQCGDYNWEILDENECAYEIVLRSGPIYVRLLYVNGILTIGNLTANQFTCDGDQFHFKIPFEETSKIIKYMIETGEYSVNGIYDKYKEPNLQ